MFGSRFKILAAVFGLFIMDVASATPGDPVAIIRKKDAELQKMLRDKESAKKTDRLKVLINGIFDFEELGKRALGPEIWKTMTPDQQSRFVKSFKSMVENASVKKLEVYQSDSTTYDAPELHYGQANVTSHVFSKGTESIVTYKLQSKDSTWKAWDLVIDDLSTARNYGEQFRKILQTSDMNGLIAKLEKKSAGASEGKPTDNMKAKSEKGTPAPKVTPAVKKSPASTGAVIKPPAATGSAAPVSKP